MKCCYYPSHGVGDNSEAGGKEGEGEADTVCGRAI